jgi:hypothetical protein
VPKPPFHREHQDDVLGFSLLMGPPCRIFKSPRQPLDFTSRMFM